MRLRTYLILALLLLPTALAPARDKPENWIEIRSPHFTVATNSGEKQGRRIADQFERMRSVFHAAFPKLQIDSGTPIIVLAVKEDKDFRALEPEAYLAKGSLKLGGLFLHAPDKNYVLMRVDAEGEHPYSVIYHEYTHLLLSKSAEWIPLWLNEGLAEFYENTEIREKDAMLGEPSATNLMLLRQNRLLPLTTLLTVDEKSPYYHEENKGSIFYAESWALTHMILTNDYANKTRRIDDYSALLQQKIDPVTAATKAFGDLKPLQQALESYVQQVTYRYLKAPIVTEIDDAAFTAKPLTDAQSDALRADFLAYNERTKDAQALLDHVLQEDASNTLAHETKGFLEFRQGHLDEAEKWYAQAVQLDSQSYLAHYYFAAIAMNKAGDSTDMEKIESSLRTAIKLNPSFAPPYDRLAVLLGTHHKNLDEARMMGLNAVQIDPSNVGYRINVANVFMAMQQPDNAIAVLRLAAKLAKTQEESATVDNFLMHVQEYAEAQKRFAAQRQGMSANDDDDDDAAVKITTTEVTNASQKTPEFVPKGPHRFLVGVLKSVHCENIGLDVTVTANGKQVALHTDNYYNLQFSALGFQPSGELNPCKDLESRPAKVEYVESANQSVAPRLLAIELHK
jgi:tetratricopeptide (TPR) repeat protein